MLGGCLVERELVFRDFDCPFSCVHQCDNIQKGEWDTYKQLEKIIRSEFHRALSDQEIGEYRKKIGERIKAESI